MIPALAAGLVALAAQTDDGFILKQPERTLQQAEAIYAGIPPVRTRPPAERHKNMPLTLERLTNGGRLNIVMLGDSIVNDTSRSAWYLVLQQRHPKCAVSVTTSVRGSTGCWWYKEPGRVRKYVLDQSPDLVIIGGISQRNDVDSIAEVVRQIREASSCDLLLMTGAFGGTDPRDDRQWRYGFDPKGSDYRALLAGLARKRSAAFLDMDSEWGRYIRESGKELDWFKRDPIHANERGEQVIGRILLQFVDHEAAARR